jgi:hypothetical protein
MIYSYVVTNIPEEPTASIFRVQYANMARLKVVTEKESPAKGVTACQTTLSSKQFRRLNAKYFWKHPGQRRALLPLTIPPSNVSVPYLFHQAKSPANRDHPHNTSRTYILEYFKRR